MSIDRNQLIYLHITWIINRGLSKYAGGFAPRCVYPSYFKPYRCPSRHLHTLHGIKAEVLIFRLIEDESAPDAGVLHTDNTNSIGSHVRLSLDNTHTRLTCCLSSVYSNLLKSTAQLCSNPLLKSTQIHCSMLKSGGDFYIKHN